jgi:hypothetical protein
MPDKLLRLQFALIFFQYDCGVGILPCPYQRICIIIKVKWYNRQAGEIKVFRTYALKPET